MRRCGSWDSVSAGSVRGRPSSSQFRGVVGHVLDFVRDSVDPGVVRALGGVAVGIGAYLVYFGARLL